MEGRITEMIGEFGTMVIRVCVAGTLLAARKVMEVRGLVRGLDQLLFHM